MSIELTINGRRVAVAPGATILEAARRLGVDIPTICHRDGLPPWTSCSLCVVRVQGRRKLLPACSARAEAGMAVTTDSPEIRAARRTALELLLSDHRGDCVAPCALACPAGLDIPGFIAEVRAGRTREAAALIRKRIPLPGVLGRVCARYCERVCRRGESDEAIAVCALKRYAADADRQAAEPFRPQCASPSGRSVGIIGAGPAGLSAAYYLLEAGHACTVYEADAAAGGMLRRIPSFRLPRAVVNAEVDVILRMGCDLRLRTAVGRDVPMDVLRREHDAVFVAAGASDRPAPGIPGANLCVPADADLLRTLGLDASARGAAVDRQTMATSAEGVFAGGDVVSGPGSVVRAVAAGRRAAVSIGQYLSGAEVTGEPAAFHVRMGGLSEADRAQILGSVVPRARVPERREPAGPSAQGLSEVVQGLSDAEARQEAARCLQCDCLARDDCRLRRYAQEYGADAGRFRTLPRPVVREESAGGVVFEPAKCIMCGLCVRIAEAHGEPLGIGFRRRGHDTHVDVPFGATLSDGLAATIRACADACPTGAIKIRACTPEQGPA